MRLAFFILRDIDQILAEWETFAATRVPAASSMTSLALRNHADKILKAIARDLSTPQTDAQQVLKSRGEAQPVPGAPETAAQTHGMLRAQSGFDIKQMTSEYRALRTSVLRLWKQACAPQLPEWEDTIRFNEAIDQALAESVAFFAERTEQSRNLFLGMLGHDMRTPLQAILMTASYLARVKADITVSEAATRLAASGKRMQSMLDDLVSFNRLNLGLGVPVNRRPADLGEVFEHEISQLRAAYPGRHIKLEVRGSTAGSWDTPCLQRMLDNLVANALKYGSQTSPVRVHVTGQADEVIVEVKNEGTPIHPDVLETLFEPPKRGVPHGEQGDGSLGLGLFIAREVVRAHGGEILARSDTTETVFVARLARETVGAF